MNLEERIAQYALSVGKGFQWEFVFDGRKRWENVAYMRCKVSGTLLFLPPFLYEDDT